MASRQYISPSPSPVTQSEKRSRQDVTMTSPYRHHKDNIGRLTRVDRPASTSKIMDFEHGAVEISVRERGQLEAYVRAHGYASLPDPDSTPAVVKFGKQLGILRPDVTANWLRQQQENHRDFSTVSDTIYRGMDDWIDGVRPGRPVSPASTFITAQTQYTVEEQPTGLTTLPGIEENDPSDRAGSQFHLEDDLGLEIEPEESEPVVRHSPVAEPASNANEPTSIDREAVLKTVQFFVNFGAALKVPNDEIARAATLGDVASMIDGISKHVNVGTHYLKVRRRKAKKRPTPPSRRSKGVHKVGRREYDLLLAEAKRFAPELIGSRDA
ncbi:hypothetical protein ABW21_db0208174 [Orbilia brochopaga]|nr:hypothetical protein ABW21_db0208174 [Drechslerella brochopaga]